MPVYNEAANLVVVLADVRRLVLDVVPGSELIVVDDRSTDASPQVLAAAAAADPRVTVVTSDVNRGHGPSVLDGWRRSSAEWILTTDSDGQVDLHAFGRLWAARHDADLVLGVRVGRHDALHRRVVTFATRALAGALVRRRVTDANTPFKLIRHDLLAHVGATLPADAFAPSVLLLVAAHRSGARVVEVPVTQRPRLHGRSTLHPRRLARALVQCTTETLRAARAPAAPYRR